MASSKIVLFLLSLFLLASTASCDFCTPDEFGPNVTLVLPVETTLPRDTLIVGDTITISMDFGKNIETEGSDKSAFLEDFQFFSEFVFSEISDTAENFEVDIEVIEVTGEIEALPLVSYPFYHLETNDSYKFEAKVVMKEAGKYLLGFTSANDRFRYHQHPFVYQCNKTRRTRISVVYSSINTTEEEFNNVFRSSPIDYFHTIYNFENFSKRAGARAFVVVEE